MTLAQLEASCCAAWSQQCDPGNRCCRIASALGRMVVRTALSAMLRLLLHDLLLLLLLLLLVLLLLLHGTCGCWRCLHL